MTDIPDSMTCLAVQEVTDPQAPPSARVKLTEKPVPRPKRGQVLVKMDAASANPSDLMYLRALYGVPPNYGAAAGFEGTGRVVASGGGLMGTYLKGKRVACGNPGGEGTWAEYMVADVSNCLPLSKDIPAEQAATLLVNPFTAFGLLDRAQELGADAVVQNAGASQVGKLVVRIAKMRGVPLISTVRRQAQVDDLKSIGAENVLLTTDDDYDRELTRLCQELKATAAFDCVSGPDTLRLQLAMPNKSTIIVYGRLHEDPDNPFGGQYAVGQLIFAGQRIEGYWLSKDLQSGGLLKLLKRSKEIQKLYADGALSTDIAGTFSLEDYPAALDDYEQNMSAGKRILRLS